MKVQTLCYGEVEVKDVSLPQHYSEGIHIIDKEGVVLAELAGLSSAFVKEELESNAGYVDDLINDI